MNYIPFEVRHKMDPYIIYAESHYNLGRDLTIFFWLSVACLLMALAFTVVLSFCFCFIKKSDGRGSGSRGREHQGKRGKGAYVREDLE